MSLSKEKVEAIKAEVERLRRAGKQFSTSAVDLWDSTISVAIAMDDLDTIKNLIARGGGVASWGDNNCACAARPQLATQGEK